MVLSEKVYDVLKWIAQILLPALTTFVGVILKCFNCPYTDIIITIMVAFDTFLGTILGISSHNYYKGGE
jgi:hypothetical protein